MNYLAVRKPCQQFREMPNVDGKLNTGPFAVAEFGNFLYQYSRNRAQASIRPLDLARDCFLQFGVLDYLDVLESPEGRVEAWDALFRKAHLDYPIHVFIDGQVTGLRFKEIFEVFVPSFAEKSRIGQPHYSRTHYNQVVPQRASGPMGPNNKYRTFHDD